MRKYILLFLLFLISISFCYPQYDSKFKKLYKTGQGFRDAGNYAEALRYFIKLDSIAPDNSNINFNVGVCYINTTYEKVRSIPYLEIAIKNVSKNYREKYNEKKAPVFAFYYLAKAYHLAYQLDRSVAYFKKFKTYFTLQDSVILKDVDRQIEMVHNAKDLMENPLDIKIDNVGPNINSPYPDYAPVISLDGNTMIFTSRRAGSTGGKLDKESKWFEDIYISKRNSENDEWSPAVQIGSNINTPRHEASISLSPDGNQLFIYKNNKNENGDIYVSKFMGSDWSTPEKLPEPINTKYWETHAYLTKDGNTLYFVSDRPGGYGGRDIYSTTKKNDGSWSIPKNLGPSINTQYEEDSPFIVEDSTGTTMFFSSQGHKSMGGFDIFTSKLKPDGTWTEADNIIYPINTSDDDVFYVPTSDRKHAYYSSSKLGGYGDQDIYYLTIRGFEKEKHVARLKGIVLDIQTLKPVKSLLVLKNDSGRSVAELNTSESGSDFDIVIDKGRKYELTVNADTYNPYSETVEVSWIDSTRNVEIYKKVLLSKQGVALNTDTTITKTVIPQNNDSVKCWTIQIGAGYNMRPSYFEKALGYKITMCNDGLKRYTMGEFNNKEEAETQKQKMVFLGYNDAYIRACFTSTSFVAGSFKKLDKIYFDFDKYNLRSESVVVLDRVVQMMNENKNMRVELLGHTDIIGSEDYNQGLSESRCKSAYEYLLSKGIDRDRIEFKGFSYRVPAVPNVSPQTRQLNRRVEFRIKGR